MSFTPLSVILLTTFMWVIFALYALLLSHYSGLSNTKPVLMPNRLKNRLVFYFTRCLKSFIIIDVISCGLIDNFFIFQLSHHLKLRLKT